MSALQDRPPVEPDVLIEEARERQRRRHRLILSTLVALAAGALVYGLTTGDGPPVKPRPTGGGGAPAGATVASWRNLTAPGGYIQAGAQVTSVIRWHGELIAAGDLFSPGRIPKGIGCTIACNPIVWVDRDGRWRAVWGHSPSGSDPGAALVAVGNQLLLFNSDMSTALWRSANAIDWTAVRIPKAMSWNWTSGIASNGRRVVVSFFNRYIGAHSLFGGLNPVFSSTDGARWVQGGPVDGFGFDDIAAVPGGFVALGASTRARRFALLRSANGRSWSVVSPLSMPRNGNELLAASGRGLVLERTVSYTRRSARAEFMWSSNGLVWTAANVVGGPLTNRLFEGPTPETLAAVRGGFVALGNTNRYVWWSADGRVWRRTTVPGGPPATFQPWATSIDGNSLLVVEMPRRASDGVPRGATTIWQLRLP